ncbi:MAG: hypothetical protein ACR2NU_12650 [Aeoliella sp.]
MFSSNDFPEVHLTLSRTGSFVIAGLKTNIARRGKSALGGVSGDRPILSGCSHAREQAARHGIHLTAAYADCNYGGEGQTSNELISGGVHR